MTQHLRRDMEKLEKHLLYLAAQVEEAVRRSMSSLFEYQPEVAQAVIERDVEIDRREIEVEEECLKILALHQPVANDLRFITACLKINNDLERIGDLAANIAERSKELSSEIRIPAPAELPRMTELATEMLRGAIDAFVQSDAARAELIVEQDDEVDRLNHRVIEGLLDTMRNDQERAIGAVAFFTVSKQLERIADHATNIAEDVVYMVSGAIIRHRGKIPSS